MCESVELWPVTICQTDGTGNNTHTHSHKYLFDSCVWSLAVKAFTEAEQVADVPSESKLSDIDLVMAVGSKKPTYQI